MLKATFPLGKRGMHCVFCTIAEVYIVLHEILFGSQQVGVEFGN